MSRFYVAETSVTATGANADNRIAVRPSEFDLFVGALAGALGAGSGAHAANEKQQAFINAMAKDLLANRGKSVVIAGEYQTPYVQSMTVAINQALGNVGQTVFYGDSLEVNPVDDLQSLTTLAADMQAGKVEMLVMLGGVNPVYSAPVDLGFAASLKKVPYVIHHGLYYDESAEFSHWHIPEAHFLESWGDARAHDGTVTIMQPLIEPLYGGKTMHEVLAIFSADPARSSHDIIKGYWTGGSKGADVDAKWQRSLHDGLVAGTQYASASGSAPTFAALQPMAPSTGYDIVFRPDPSVLDGRFANNGWLQELPKPITKLTWDNAALVSPNTAKKLGLASTVEMKGGAYTADVVYISVGDNHIKLPVWVTPGQPDDTVAVQLGYGRWRGGQVANGKGVNVNAIRTSKNPWFVPGAKVVKTGETYDLAGTQIHFTMEGREPVMTATLAEYAKNAHFAHEHEEEPSKDASIFPKFEYKGYAWGMTIDLKNSIGCNACMIACQSENNIPVVGKEQVMRSREMHWIRVDRYYTGAAEEPETYFQPVPCMQCENAPCELVCPVEATSHSAEGLNDMTYNRCVGTRYCGNNCPYKVRRFNFLLFQDWNTPSYKMMRNPEVSIRSRGVMEKCTYCVQRIQSAKIDAEKENRSVRDGEIVTACQATCPTEAIVFGDINDPNSRVSKLKADSRNYSLLAELNTQPRTTYLANVRNPNPELSGSREHAERA
jgi:molybdopterin-containing oxidoreductase family iron-sulfur binding subunit